MGTVFTEKDRAGAALVSESNGSRSREVIVVEDGVTVEANSVVAVITATSNLTPFDPAGTDGSENPVGISFGEGDATDGEVDCVVFVRDAEFNAEEIVWDDAVAPAEKLAASETLAAKGLVLREAS